MCEPSVCYKQWFLLYNTLHPELLRYNQGSLHSYEGHRGAYNEIIIALGMLVYV